MADEAAGGPGAFRHVWAETGVRRSPRRSVSDYGHHTFMLLIAVHGTAASLPSVWKYGRTTPCGDERLTIGPDTTDTCISRTDLCTLDTWAEADASRSSPDTYVATRSSTAADELMDWRTGFGSLSRECGIPTELTPLPPVACCTRLVLSERPVAQDFPD